jgi:hypothetical protein
VSTTYTWRDHFETKLEFENALDSICEQIDKLESGPVTPPLEHACRGQFAVMLMQYGEAVCTRAYQSTHDAVRDGERGKRPSIWMPSAYIQGAAKRIAEEGQ